ncbi:hypothetical protein BDD43_3375 [Mucilaginibacter gracilis]|uniref:Uncharacterized protein n=1 Tax=Mucilaginibacter gracilis TaxID=423350 RepID=A0A495J2W6_9SPHI|nr:hypothetical protein [Mucilaginibacter gracilis]RKR83173.1 hypothetical protein BDD43_3375 [Mucilaginibacter gracilis]
MKKLVTPAIPNGGLPLYAAEMIGCFQTEIYRAILAPYLQYGEPLIINGCIVGDTEGGVCTITAGMALIDGDLIDVPAYNGAWPVYLHQDAPTYVQKPYKDQTPRNVTVEKKCTWLPTVPPVTGEYILFDPYTSQYLRDVKRRYETAIYQLVPFADYPDATRFDVNGVGKWEWKGFAVPNGWGGLTFNLSGKAFVQFDPADADLALRNTHGSKTNTITQANLPNINLPIDIYENGTGNGDGKHIAASDNENMHEGTASIPLGGSGTALNNMQQSYMGTFLQRYAV